MTKRYYICRVIGEGTQDNPWTSELREFIYAYWPNEPHFIYQAIHAPTLMWCIMKYDLSDLAYADVMVNLTGIFDFPAGALDRELSEIPSVKRQAIKTKLEAVGFDFDWATLSNTIRDVLKYLIHSTQLASWAEIIISSGNFDLNKTVADIPLAKRQKVNQHMQDLAIPTGWITLSTTIEEVVRKIMFLDDGVTERLFGTPKRKQWFWHDEDTE